MVDVCYVVSQGFAARMVLHSELVTELRLRGLSVAVVTPNADEPGMQSLSRDLDAQLHPALGRQNLAASLTLNRLQRYIFEDVAGNPALLAKHLRDRDDPRSRTWQRMSARAFMWLNRASMRFAAVPTSAARLQRRLLQEPAVRDQLSQMRPKIVVVTYPANFIEAAYLHHAQELGIKTVAHLLSWDNITCKGRFPVVAPNHISWGPIMTEELQEYYGVEAPDTFECGVPHFDAHARPVEPAVMAELLSSLGLNPARPYLFFGMSSPYFAPREIDVVEHVARQVRADAFGDDMQLVVRPHPQNVQGNMADVSWLPRLESLRGTRVAVDIPNLEKSKLKWNMRRDDLPKLVALIAGSSVSLNSGSTLSIDAVLHDKPVVITAFDAEERGLPWYLSARRVVEYGHLKKLIDLGGVRVVSSYDELDAAVLAYLQDPSEDGEGRARTRERECGACDGGAAARVARALDELVCRPVP